MYRVGYARIAGTTVVTPQFIELVPNVESFPPAEAVIEYASRLCYNSNDKFGTNPNFIKGLIKAGHLDVLEHGAMAIVLDIFFDPNTDNPFFDLFTLKNKFPYMKLDVTGVWNRAIHIIISANLRTWQEFVWEHQETKSDNILFTRLDNAIYPTIASALYTVAPNIFSFADDGRLPQMQDEYERILLAEQDARDYRVRPYPYTLTGAKVVPLGFMSVNGKYSFDVHLNHSAYLVNNVSRAFSHQHVRHRLMSFSQMSQRYVDYDKQGDGFIYPTGLSENQRIIFDNHFDEVKFLYGVMRESKMKKEDARAILPNAAITHLVFSAFEDGINHYLKLRTAKDAQEEIRLVADLVKAHNVAIFRSL